ATVPVGTPPGGIAVNPIDNRIYVTYPSTHSLIEFDPTSNSTIATIPVGLTSFGVAINSATNRTYVTDLSSNSLYVFDASSDHLITTVSVPSPFAVAVNE